MMNTESSLSCFDAVSETVHGTFPIEMDLKCTLSTTSLSWNIEIMAFMLINYFFFNKIQSLGCFFTKGFQLDIMN